MSEPVFEPMKLIVSIVDRGKGAAMIRLYTENRVFLHWQCPGKGTATSEILDILGLGSSEKDVVFSFTTAQAARRLLSDLDSELRGRVKTLGLAFSLPLTSLNRLIAAAITYKTQPLRGENGGEDMESAGKSSLILVACNRGFTDPVMATAKARGARGGTVIKARWTGTEDLEQSYGLDLSAEKEIVAIVVPAEQRNAILEAINAQHGLRSKAQAMLCSLPIEQIVRLG